MGCSKTYAFFLCPESPDKGRGCACPGAPTFRTQAVASLGDDLAWAPGGLLLWAFVLATQPTLFSELKRSADPVVGPPQAVVAMLLMNRRLDLCKKSVLPICRG